MKFYVANQIGKRRSLTPEGFIVCHDVPIARTGEMLYGPEEVPVEAGRDGLVRIERLADDVFRPETVASYEGKPVTIDHPVDFVTPDNWRELAVGVVQNVRRGTGAEDDLLLADLLITDSKAIAMVGDDVQPHDLPEVSCGYEADYEQTEPGRGLQRNIIGNHVALVERGRCGSRCAIGDQQKDDDMQTKDAAKKRTWRDRLMAAFKARDEEAVKAAMDEAEEEMGDEGGDQPQKLVIEVKGAGTAAGGDEDPEPEAKDEDPVAALTAQVAALTEMVKKLAGAEECEGEEGTEDEDPDAEKTGDEDEVQDEEQPAKTGDSLGRALRDTIARAEILAPGAVKAPTIDAKNPKKSRDALCGCKRKALDAALKGDHGERIKPLLAGKAIDKMDCRTLDTVFVSASEVVKAINNAASTSGVRANITTRDFGRAPSIIADINKRNAEFWAQRDGTK